MQEPWIFLSILKWETNIEWLKATKFWNIIKQKCDRQNKLRQKYKCYILGNLLKIPQNRQSGRQKAMLARSVFFVELSANYHNNQRTITIVFYGNFSSKMAKYYTAKLSGAASNTRSESKIMIAQSF